MPADSPKEVEAAIKTIIPGHTVVLLENGDTIIMGISPQAVRAVVGKRDAQGNQEYNLELAQSIGVVGKHARGIDGAKTQQQAAHPDGRNGEQPGGPGVERPDQGSVGPGGDALQP